MTSSQPFAPIDPGAGAAVMQLATRLQGLGPDAVLFGHQDAFVYGHRGWTDPGESDVHAVTGSHPAVIGFDLGRLELGHTHNIDGVSFEAIRRGIVDAHARGAVVTLSWHAVNPVTSGGYGDNTSPDAIARVLSGGSHHEVLVGWLARLAHFIESLVNDAGQAIPIIFRPYHEHTGDWFWWGIDGDLNRPSAFNSLWRFTVTELHETHGLHGLLWALSPDRSRMPIDDLEQAYLDSYPGDDYVDVLGIDDYWDAGHAANPAPLDQQFADYVRTLEVVGRLAHERGKLAALTETQVPTTVASPWTGYLQAALSASADTRRHTWALVWRNPPGEPGGAPHIGASDAADLAALRAGGLVRFLDDLAPADRTSRSDGQAHDTA